MWLLRVLRLGRRARPPSASTRTASQSMLRAGQSAELTPEQAALRAQGQNAWMRPGGFG